MIKMTILLFAVWGFMFSSIANADMTVPAKKRIFDNDNRIFKRNPIYPWSLSDLSSKYGPDRKQAVEIDSDFEQFKQQREMKESAMDDVLDDPALEPFVQ